MTKSNSNYGVACGIFFMIFVSGYFSMINEEDTSFKITEYMQKRKFFFFMISFSVF
jgi:hypothetical protein